MMHHLPSHAVVFWVHRNLFVFMIGCQVPCDHVIAICNLLSWILKKVNAEVDREISKQMGKWI